MQRGAARPGFPPLRCRSPKRHCLERLSGLTRRCAGARAPRLRHRPRQVGHHVVRHGQVRDLGELAFADADVAQPMRQRQAMDESMTISSHAPSLRPAGPFAAERVEQQVSGRRRSPASRRRMPGASRIACDMPCCKRVAAADDVADGVHDRDHGVDRRHARHGAGHLAGGACVEIVRRRDRARQRIAQEPHGVQRQRGRDRMALARIERLDRPRHGGHAGGGSQRGRRVHRHLRDRARSRTE